MLKGFFCFFTIVLSQAAVAQDHEGYALKETIQYYEQLFSNLENQGKTDAALRDASILKLDFDQRLYSMKETRYRGQGVNTEFIRYIEQEASPRLARILDKWPGASGQIFYEKSIVQTQGELDQAQSELSEFYERIATNSPKINRLLQLLSFARSDTIGAGSIGDWNPNSNSAIQDSAINGLLEVLDLIEQKGRNQSIDIVTLSDYHRRLIGASEHHFSRGGVINDIVFKQEDGGSRHVKEYLSEWEKRVAERQPGLVSAFEAYTEFLHLHPFGDVNGRIAEVIKQAVLFKAGLPSIITREKTSSENYLYQPIFGRGLYTVDLLNMARETKDFLEQWERVLGKSGVILDVQLVGPNIISTIERSEKTFVIVNNRSYQATAGIELPPIESAPVLVGRHVKDLKMRYSVDGWQNVEETRPISVTLTERIGRTKLVYPFFEIEAPSLVGGRGRLEFVFNYDHPTDGVVWFNNNERNFQVNLDVSGGARCGALGEQFGG